MPWNKTGAVPALMRRGVGEGTTGLRRMACVVAGGTYLPGEGDLQARRKRGGQGGWEHVQGPENLEEGRRPESQEERLSGTCTSRGYDEPEGRGPVGTGLPSHQGAGPPRFNRVKSAFSASPASVWRGSLGLS